MQSPHVPPLRSVTPDEIQQFWASGVVHLPSILDLEQVGAMEAPVEAALRSDEVVDLGSLSIDDQEQNPPGSGTFAAGLDHWKTSEQFARFACEGALPAIAAQILESREVWLYEDSVLVKEPGSLHRTQFHTDLGYFHVDGRMLCTFWVPLDPADISTGAVQYLEGSHLDDRDFRPNLFVISEPIPGTLGHLAPDLWTDPRQSDRLVGFAVEPGDVVVHHARTLHGAPGNESATSRRRAISVRYCGDDARYKIRPGAPRKAHHLSVLDGDPLGGPDCPQVWPPTTLSL